MKSLAARISLVMLVGLIGLAGCSKNEETFCNQAWEYLQFQPTIGDVAEDTSKMKAFVKEWDDRLESLHGVAPDHALAELSLMRAGVQGFDDDLAEVDYDIFQLPVDNLMDPSAEDASARFDLILSDECQINSEGAEVLVPAPDPLDSDEFDQLVEGDTDADAIAEELRADLQEQLGLTQQESGCLIAGIGPEDLDQLVSGNVDEESAAVIVAALATCGIDLG